MSDRPYGEDSCDYCASQIESTAAEVKDGRFCSPECSEQASVDYYEP